jgi:hypothetical protein
VAEMPVTWREDPDSRVRVVRTVLTDLRGVVRMMRSSLTPVATSQVSSGLTALSERAPTGDVLKDLFDNPSYIGKVRVDGQLIEGKHPALIDEAT